MSPVFRRAAEKGQREQPVRIRVLLTKNREFRGLVLAQVTSEIGDHFARFALAALVFERSDSMVTAALAFVVGYLPGIFGAVLLAPFADRVPRKRVLLVCDAARAVLVALLALVAVSGTPIWALFGLLLASQLFSPPFEAARAALMPDLLLDSREFFAGTSLTRALYQINQVIGLTVAGVVVTAFSARTALAIDALTFGLSFLILLTALRPRRAPIEGRAGVRGFLADTAEGARIAWIDPLRRVFIGFVWATALLLIAPEAVAIAYADEHDVSNLSGALMATIPAGAAVGVAIISRIGPTRAVRVVRVLAVLSFVPLILTAVDPGVYVAAGLWFVSGMLQAYLVPVIVTVNLATPAHFRGRLNGLAGGGLGVATALGFLAAGALADLISPQAATAIAGVTGVVVVGLFSLAWPKVPEQPATGGSPQR
ncbi:MAG TPA: MFS transporter [Actinomycetes bacterium]|nr:MFS transporter [Actinomycetes bacterium]